MSVWSKVQFNNLFEGIDIAAEHYHTAKLKWLSHLEAMGGDTIKHIADPIRQIVSPNPDIPVFDLSPAQKHILQKEDSQTEDRVSTKKVAQSGDVIISRLRSYLQQVAFIPNELGLIHLSTEFIVLRGKAENDIRFLVPYLLSKPIQTILQWSQDGNEHPRFNEKVLLKLRVVPAVRSIAKTLGQLVDKAAESLSVSKDLYAQAEGLFLSELGLGDLDLSPTLFYERPFWKTQQAARLDAEFFQPKYYRLLEKLNTCPFRKDALGNLIEPIKNGFDFREFSEEGLPYVRVGDVSKGRIEIETAKRVNIQWEEIKKGIRLRVGDVLMTRKGSYGIAALVREGQEDSVISSEIMLLRIKDTSLLPEYLTVYLNSSVGFHQVERFVHGVAFYSISQPDLASIRIVMAPEQLQKQIATLVQKSDAALNESRRLLEEAKRMVEVAVYGGKS